jgi:hypothetical protein
MTVGMLRLPDTGDSQTVEDQMDAFAAEIETKLTQTALRGILPSIKTFAYDGTPLMGEVEDDDGNTHAEIHIAWRIGYATLEGSPGSLL